MTPRTGTPAALVARAFTCLAAVLVLVLVVVEVVSTALIPSTRVVSLRPVRLVALLTAGQLDPVFLVMVVVVVVVVVTVVAASVVVSRTTIRTRPIVVARTARDVSIGTVRRPRIIVVTRRKRRRSNRCDENGEAESEF